MKAGQIRLLALLAVVVTLFATYRWWASDQRRIRARFASLQTELEKSGKEGTLDRFAHARAVDKLFADGFVIRAQPYEGTLTDRQELMAVVDRYRESAETVRVGASDVLLTVRENATAEMSAIVEAVGERAGGPGRERLRLRIAWRKDDGEWRIQELEVLEVLDSSGLFF
ncbi:MAG: nuclear transport factor 2 family protein [Thermoanaerobaculia bacterium]